MPSRIDVLGLAVLVFFLVAWVAMTVVGPAFLVYLLFKGLT